MRFLQQHQYESNINKTLIANNTKISAAPKWNNQMSSKRSNNRWRKEELGLRLHETKKFDFRFLVLTTQQTADSLQHADAKSYEAVDTRRNKTLWITNECVKIITFQIKEQTNECILILRRYKLGKLSTHSKD